MKKKITYNLNNGLINPRYVGLVRASTPKNYEIEEYDEVPEHVININSCFSSSVNLHKDMELIDCVSEDDIFTIDLVYSSHKIQYNSICNQEDGRHYRERV